jgi:lipoprotein-anchoring transpeptidase ErfK/SrfK
VRTRSSGLVVGAALLSASFLALVPAPAPAGAAGGATAAYVSLPTPTRLVDTRDAGVPLGPGGTQIVDVTGQAPLPADGAAIAVVLNVTIAGPAAIGYWTAWPHDAAQPTASNVNVDEAASLLGIGLAVANLVTVPLGPSGLVDVFASGGGHLVVDMLGYYTPRPASSAGRLVPLGAPQRILDTRDTGTFLGAGETREVRVPGAAGSSAVVLNMTTIAFAAGYWTAFPSGSEPPLASNLNSLAVFHTVANQVIVPVDADGDFSVYSSGGGHLLVDLVGTFTGAAAPSTSAGLFVPLDRPTRFLDTREPSLNPLGGGQFLAPGWAVEVAVGSHPAIARSDVAAVSLNLTVTGTFAAGFASVTPGGSNDPTARNRSTSNVNVVRAGQTVPNHVTVPVSSRGFDVFLQSGGHVVADVAGYYIGASAPAPYGGPQNTNPVPGGCVGFAGNPVSAIQFGSSAATIAATQRRLLDLGFWLTATDGSYGWTTSQAVMAFQKWQGIPASGNVDETTAAAMNLTPCRPNPGVPGDLLEVDKGRQLAFFVRGGKALWVLNVSTGGNYDYEYTDPRTGGRVRDKAVTPTGTFHVYRVSDQPAYEGTLGVLYRPRFVVGGVAVHGYRSVPNYPASHGCIRVSNPAMDMIWAQNLMPMGGTVVIHE